MTCSMCSLKRAICRNVEFEKNEHYVPPARFIPIKPTNEHNHTKLSTQMDVEEGNPKNNKPVLARSGYASHSHRSH